MNRNNLLLSLSTLVLTCAPALTDKDKEKDTPTPLPEKVVAAWKKAGAEAGWMGKDGFRGLGSGVKPTPGDVLTFRMSKRPKDGWDKLPAVEQPFALFLASHDEPPDLAGISSLKDLRFLYLWKDIGLSYKVSDEGLKHLAGVKQLHTLDLSFTDVTDAGLKHVASIKQLHTLGLDWGKVTDAGLMELASLKQLRALSLSGCFGQIPSQNPAGRFTAKGVKKLQKALPKLRIVGLPKPQ